MNSLQWLQFMLSYIVQASLVIGIAWGLERWTQASQAKVRIWTACYVSILVLMFAGLMLPRLQWFHPWSTIQPSELLLLANTEHLLGRSLLAIWALGSSVVLLHWLVQFVALQRFLRSIPRLSTTQRLRLTAALPEDHDQVNGRAVDYRVSPEDLGPFCYQFHRPIICLPHSIIQGPAKVLKHVVQHELTHLQTQHPLQLFLQRAVQTMLWFHPLVWMSSDRAGLVREFVCDDVATRETGSTITYLRALVSVVEERSAAHGNTLAIGRSKMELATRARRLANQPDDPCRTASWRSVTVLLLAAIVCSQIWLPTNPLASTRSRWSPWPTWSAATLHAFNVSARDYERFDHRTELHEWLEDARDAD